MKVLMYVNDANMRVRLWSFFNLMGEGFGSIYV